MFYLTLGFCSLSAYSSLAATATEGWWCGHGRCRPSLSTATQLLAEKKNQLGASSLFIGSNVAILGTNTRQHLLADSEMELLGVWCGPGTAAAKQVETAGTCWLIRENASLSFMGGCRSADPLVSLHIHLKNTTWLWGRKRGEVSACTNHNSSCKRSLVFRTNSGTRTDASHPSLGGKSSRVHSGSWIVKSSVQSL